MEALVGEKVKQATCGWYHNVVCTEDGHVFTFGTGDNGALGHRDKECKTSPVLVQAFSSWKENTSRKQSVAGIIPWL